MSLSSRLNVGPNHVSPVRTRGIVENPYSPPPVRWRFLRAV